MILTCYIETHANREHITTYYILLLIIKISASLEFLEKLLYVLLIQGSPPFKCRSCLFMQEEVNQTC